MLIRMPVENLEAGMYVQELDKAWTETTFPFQGFIIRSEHELAELQRCCRFVLVNDKKSTLNASSQRKIDAALRPHTRRNPLTEIKFEPWEGEEKLKRTLASLKRMQQAVDVELQDIYAAAAHKYSVDSNRVSLIADEIYRALTTDPRIGRWIALMQTGGTGIAEHCRNVAVLSMGFARHLGLPEYLISLIGEGALLHDIGLSRIPPRLLNRHKVADDGVMRLVKLHASYARDCIQAYRQVPQEMIDIIELHHVRMDGSGYPAHAPRKVEDYVYVVAICDIFEEMTSYRSYRDPLSPEEALVELDRMGGRQLPGKLVQEFIAYLGIYPRGNFVMLENGAIGVVVSTHDRLKTRPVLRILRGPDRIPGGDGYLDLALLGNAEREAGWRIVRSVHPLKLGFQVDTAGNEPRIVSVAT